MTCGFGIRIRIPSNTFVTTLIGSRCPPSPRTSSSSIGDPRLHREVKESKGFYDSDANTKAPFPDRLMAPGPAFEPRMNEGEHRATSHDPCIVATSAGRNFAVAVLVLVFLLLPLLHGFDKPAKAMDEGSLLVYPELILKGSLPYRDFETFYGPANIYLLSGVYSLFRPGILPERATGLVYRLLIFAAIFCIGTRWGASLAAGAAVIAGALLLNLGVVAYAWMGGIACALWAIFLVSERASRHRCLFGGVLAAVALLFRPDLGFAVIIGMLPLFPAMDRSSKLYFLGGVCGGLLPL